MVAQASTNPADASLTQEADCRVAQQRHDGGAVPAMDQAVIFPQGHILEAVQAILNAPMCPFEGQESVWRPRLGGRLVRP